VGGGDRAASARAPRAPPRATHATHGRHGGAAPPVELTRPVPCHLGYYAGRRARPGSVPVCPVRLTAVASLGWGGWMGQDGHGGCCASRDLFWLARVGRPRGVAAPRPPPRGAPGGRISADPPRRRRPPQPPRDTRR